MFQNMLFQANQIKQTKVKCSHCGRWVVKHFFINGKIYGSTCVKKAK